MKRPITLEISLKKYFTRIRYTFPHVFVAIERVSKANNLEIIRNLPTHI